jgi:carbamate kinase
MRIVIALGGNALLRRREPRTAETQRANVWRAVTALLPLFAAGHQLVVTHGNGPQVGLLALQAAAGPKDGAYPLDLLDAESEGMLGYPIEQELDNALPAGRLVATLLTQVLVDGRDPAFGKPTKPIGPFYDEAAAIRLRQARSWAMAEVGIGWRRVVPSPRPLKVLEARVIDLLVPEGVTVICAGGGGIPVLERSDGTLVGVEAVIDKDLASALLAPTGAQTNQGSSSALGHAPSTQPASLRARWGPRSKLRSGLLRRPATTPQLADWRMQPRSWPAPPAPGSAVPQLAYLWAANTGQPVVCVCVLFVGLSQPLKPKVRTVQLLDDVLVEDFHQRTNAGGLLQPSVAHLDPHIGESASEALWIGDLLDALIQGDSVLPDAELQSHG